MFRYLLFTAILFSSKHVNAQESSALVEGMNTVLEMRERIENLQNEISTLQTWLDNAKSCGDTRRHYDGNNCVTIAEQDPEIESHGKKAMVAACTNTDQVPYFNLSRDSWECKTVTN